MPLGKKIKMYYDPRGQVIKTVNPDNSLQTVFFGEVSDLANPQNYTPTPWASFSYDANDNGDRRTGGKGLTPASNINTPKSSEIDPLGRTIKTTEHKAHLDSGTSTYVDVEMQYSFDIRGNQLIVTDPNNRNAFTYKYDYANRNLWTKHIDSGESTINMDVMGKPIEAQNAKGGETLSSYDILNRPIRLWAKDDSAAPFTLRQYPIYGDNLTATGKTAQQTKDLNLYGQGWKLYDEAGMVHTEDYDFKGNLLEKTRQVIKDSELLSVFTPPPVNWQVNPYIVDWTGLPIAILDSQQMVTTMTYDALNRAMNVMYPNDVNGNRKILTPTYNKAGTVLSVDYDGTEYIKEIAYDAKGQPLLTAYGNNIMTRYAYNQDTFRVERLKSEKYVYSNLANNPTYAPQAGSTKQDFAYEYDLVGNIMKLHDRTPDCGILGSVGGVDALDKQFNYDPLYRVISASGRESTNQNPNILWGTVAAAGSPNANNAQAYTQSFQYDKLGNMEKLQQTGNNAYTRNYIYNNYANDNKLSRIEGTGSPAPVYSNFSYDVNGNMTTSATDRSYIWDAADQLRAFSIQAGTSEPSIYAQYLYSGGQRIKKIVRTTGGDYEVTVYDGSFEYMKKVSGGTTYEKNYTHIEGAATVRTGNGTPFPGDITDDIVYNLGDNIGSINVRLSNTGTLIDREEYYPFGDTSLRTFTYKRYRYVNKEKDSESGLYYYGARYYASWTCRFISVDPLAADFPFYCSYQYAGNKPINSTDINGMAESGSSGQNGGGDPTKGGVLMNEVTIYGNNPEDSPYFIGPKLPKTDFSKKQEESSMPSFKDIYTGVIAKLNSENQGTYTLGNTIAENDATTMISRDGTNLGNSRQTGPNNSNKAEKEAVLFELLAKMAINLGDETVDAINDAYILDTKNRLHEKSDVLKYKKHNTDKAKVRFKGDSKTVIFKNDGGKVIKSNRFKMVDRFLLGVDVVKVLALHKQYGDETDPAKKAMLMQQIEDGWINAAYNFVTMVTGADKYITLISLMDTITKQDPVWKARQLHWHREQLKDKDRVNDWNYHRRKIRELEGRKGPINPSFNPAN